MTWIPLGFPETSSQRVLLWGPRGPQCAFFHGPEEQRHVWTPSAPSVRPPSTGGALSPEKARWVAREWPSTCPKNHRKYQESRQSQSLDCLRLAFTAVKSVNQGLTVKQLEQLTQDKDFDSTASRARVRFHNTENYPGEYRGHHEMSRGRNRSLWCYFEVSEIQWKEMVRSFWLKPGWYPDYPDYPDVQWMVCPVQFVTGPPPPMISLSYNTLHNLTGCKLCFTSTASTSQSVSSPRTLAWR